VTTDHNTLEINRLQHERDAAHRAIDDLTTQVVELKTQLAAAHTERDKLLASAMGRRTAAVEGPTCDVTLSCIDAVGVSESMRALVVLGKVPEQARRVYMRVADQLLSAARLALGLVAKEERVEVVS
jgi:hypothetical protein